MEDRRDKFNRSIHSLLFHALEKESLELPVLAQKIGESEDDVRACFENAAKCQPEILFKVSKALGVGREIMLLMHFYTADG
ncbi:MAG: hypothetical protein AABZ31_07335 [Bdellovibrionota bacterium]